MKTNTSIIQELEQLDSPLGHYPNPPFRVPPGYFDGLAVSVLNRIRTMEELKSVSTLIAGLPKTNPYQVPAHYFNELEQRVLRADHAANQDPAEELADLSPFLGGLKKQMPFEVPAGYFESGVSPVVTPVVPLRSTSFTRRRWFRVAAAAMVTGVLIVTGLLFIPRKEDAAAMPMARYENKLNKEIKKMSDEELNDFMQYTDVGLTTSENGTNNNSIEIKNLLKDVPDNELTRFLEETSDMDAGTEVMN